MAWHATTRSKERQEVDDDGQSTVRRAWKIEVEVRERIQDVHYR